MGDSDVRKGLHKVEHGGNTVLRWPLKPGVVVPYPFSLLNQGHTRGFETSWPMGLIVFVLLDLMK
jgi:hypothetical protein